MEQKREGEQEKERGAKEREGEQEVERGGARGRRNKREAAHDQSRAGREFIYHTVLPAGRKSAMSHDPFDVV